MSETPGGALEDSMTSVEQRPVLLESLGVQLSMISHEMQSDVPGTLAALRKIGYRTIEGSLPAGITAAAFRAELDQAGLSCPSIHVSIDAGLPDNLALGDTDAVISTAKTLGATNAVVPTISIMKLLRRPDAKELLQT